MEITILSQAKDEIEVLVKGETHTLMNIIKSTLLDDSRVETAFYDVKRLSNSVEREPVLYIKTMPGEKPIEILKDVAVIVFRRHFQKRFSKNKRLNLFWNIFFNFLRRMCFSRLQNRKCLPTLSWATDVDICFGNRYRYLFRQPIVFKILNEATLC